MDLKDNPLVIIVNQEQLETIHKILFVVWRILLLAAAVTYGPEILTFFR